MPLPRRPGRLSLRRLAPRATKSTLSLRRRLGTIAIGLLVILYGMAKLNPEQGGMYENYWGGQAYAPFVILAGAIVVLGAIVRGRDTSVLERKDRPVEFPHETVKRPWSR